METDPIKWKFALGLYAVLTLFGAANASAYYYGTYSPSDSNSAGSPPAPSPAPAENPPPVVYRRVPSRRAMYQAPDWASPEAAALAPWPWNFNFGGGPTLVAGSNDQLTGGSNFEFGGGYNLSPQAGFVLEFMNSWLGVTDHALRQNGAIDGSAYIWSFTVNPIYRFQIGGPIGGYLIGGGGFYEVETRYREPVSVFIPTFDGGFLATGLETVRQTDDAGGLNIGAGLTWNMGWGTKFFMEARYRYIFTSGTGTQVIPITFGIRW